MAKNPQVRAAIYARVSLDRTGEELSVTTQLEDSRDLCEKRGWAVEGEYVDNSVSAAGRVERKRFTALIAAIEAGQLDAIVGRTMDRITRNARDRLVLTEACRDNNVIIALTKGSDMDPTTAAGRLVMGVLGEVAQHEIELKSERQKRAERQRAESGKPQGKGERALGYTLTGEIVEDEAVIVRRIFDRFLLTDSIRGVARELEAAGVPTRKGRPWHPATVRSVLTNPRYAGRVVYGGQVLEGVKAQWKPIIEPEIFDLVQARLAAPERRTTRHSTARAHLGSGLYLCAECDGPLSILGGGSYQCRSGHVSRSRGPVDTAVTTVIVARLRRPDMADLLAGATDEGVSELMDAATRVRTKLGLVDEEYVADLIDARLHRAKTERLKSELAEVEKAMTTQYTGAAVGGVLAAPDPGAAFETADLAAQRAVVAALCTVRLRKNVRGRNTFDPNTVVIEWK